MRLTFEAIGRVGIRISRTGSAMVRAASEVRSTSMLDESASVCGSYLSNADERRLMKMVNCQIFGCSEVSGDKSQPAANLYVHVARVE